MARKPNSGNAEQNEAEDILNGMGFDTEDTGPVDDGGDNEDLENQELEQPGDEEQQPPGDDNEEEEDENISEAADELERAAREAEQQERQPQREERQPQQQQQRGGPTNPFDPRAKLQTDKAGAIYINGKKVANGGAEARIFMGFRKFALGEQQAAQKLAGHVNNVASAAKEIMARYEELSKTKTMWDQSGATPQEQSEALSYYQAYKKNPVEALKLMLTKAHMAGVDIKSITGSNGGIDAKALMDEMSGRMSELMKPLLTQTSVAERTNKLAKEAEGFFDRNPAARDVSKLVGGSHQLGLILKEAKRVAPDISMDEHFRNLHYQLLLQHNGRLPTGPVDDRGGKKDRQIGRRLNRNFKRTVTQDGGIESVDDIARSVLQDANRLTARGI